jgi:hypothetical protein
VALQTLILAGNPREGREYANRAQLRRWTYRVIHGPGQIKGLPWAGTEVHILPSFNARANRSAILSVLRWKKVEYFYVDPDDFPTLEELAEQEQSGRLGELDDDVLEAAYAENESFDHTGFAYRAAVAKLESMSPQEVASWVASQQEPEKAEIAVQAVKAKSTARPKPKGPQSTTAPAPTAATFFASS